MHFRDAERLLVSRLDLLLAESMSRSKDRLPLRVSSCISLRVSLAGAAARASIALQAVQSGPWFDFDIWGMSTYKNIALEGSFSAILKPILKAQLVNSFGCCFLASERPTI